MTSTPDAEQRYAEGRREEVECCKCGQPIWIVYHGLWANYTVEPRVGEVPARLIEELRILSDWFEDHGKVRGWHSRADQMLYSKLCSALRGSLNPGGG